MSLDICADFTRHFGWPSRPGRPFAIGHRGASAHRSENTLAAFRAASELGAEMWELDVQLTADGVPVVSHDGDLARRFGVEGRIVALTAAEVAALTRGELPTFAETVDLALELGAGLYVEIKADGAGLKAWKILKEKGLRFAALGSFCPHHVRELSEAGCDYPLSVLVPVGADPFALADEAAAGAIHLCWERASDTPQHLVTPELLARAEAQRLAVVLWHEERPAVVADLMKLPVLAICSDRPEMLAPWRAAAELPIAPCCHRGANRFAPENTLEAARICFDFGMEFVELDVTESADGVAVVIHDQTVDRTTNGTGAVADLAWAELSALDAGSWFSPHFAGTRLPRLEEMLALAKNYGRQLYIELKLIAPQLVLKLVTEAGMLERCIFWSPDLNRLLALAALSPAARIMKRRRDAESLAALFDAAPPAVVEFDPRYDDVGEMAACKARGAKAMALYFGADPAAFQQLLRAGPDLMNIDRMDVFRKAYAALGGIAPA